MVVLSWVTSLRLWVTRPGRSAEAALAFLMSGWISAMRAWVSFRVAVSDCMAAAVEPWDSANWPVMSLRLAVTAARFLTSAFMSLGSMAWLRLLIWARVDFT